VKTQDAVAQALASSIKRVFVGVAKHGMVKKCVCPNPLQRKPLSKEINNLYPANPAKCAAGK
jgi:hypothetical protein